MLVAPVSSFIFFYLQSFPYVHVHVWLCVIQRDTCWLLCTISSSHVARCNEWQITSIYFINKHDTAVMFLSSRHRQTKLNCKFFSLSFVSTQWMNDSRVNINCSSIKSQMYCNFISLNSRRLIAYSWLPWVGRMNIECYLNIRRWRIELSIFLLANTDKREWKLLVFTLIEFHVNWITFRFRQPQPRT